MHLCDVVLVSLDAVLNYLQASFPLISRRYGGVLRGNHLRTLVLALPFVIPQSVAELRLATTLVVNSSFC